MTHGTAEGPGPGSSPEELALHGAMCDMASTLYHGVRDGTSSFPREWVVLPGDSTVRIVPDPHFRECIDIAPGPDGSWGVAHVMNPDHPNQESNQWILGAGAAPQVTHYVRLNGRDVPTATITNPTPGECEQAFMAPVRPLNAAVRASRQGDRPVEAVAIRRKNPVMRAVRWLINPV